MLEKKVAEILIDRRKTLAVAESCSGGLLTHRLTNISGSSKFLKVSLITYSNEAKSKLLRIPPALIKKHGAVSKQVALAMAKNIRKIWKTHYSIAITGIAGPTGGSKEKPIGLTYIAVSSPTKTYAVKYTFKGSRLKIKNQAANKALKLFLRNNP